MAFNARRTRFRLAISASFLAARAPLISFFVFASVGSNLRLEILATFRTLFSCFTFLFTSLFTGRSISALFEICCFFWFNGFAFAQEIAATASTAT